ncbi:hypothetical protein DFS34DRAFT_650649 [Phlyctochytrium arcticum]|nr:hypothetical protein DFS34DRAFT_650649 [Phlyctochytrium arcticum]
MRILFDATHSASSKSRNGPVRTSHDHLDEQPVGTALTLWSIALPTRTPRQTDQTVEAEAALYNQIDFSHDRRVGTICQEAPTSGSPPVACRKAHLKAQTVSRCRIIVDACGGGLLLYAPRRALPRDYFDLQAIVKLPAVLCHHNKQLQKEQSSQAKTSHILLDPPGQKVVPPDTLKRPPAPSLDNVRYLLHLSNTPAVWQNQRLQTSDRGGITSLRQTSYPAYRRYTHPGCESRRQPDKEKRKESSVAIALLSGPEGR